MLNLWIWIFFALLLPVRLASGDDLAISIPIQLTHAQNLDPSPSADGKKLVFISVISGKEQLFTMDTDGKNINQLTRDDTDGSMPTTRNDIVPGLDWLNQSSS